MQQSDLPKRDELAREPWRSSSVKRMKRKSDKISYRMPKTSNGNFLDVYSACGFSSKRFQSPDWKELES